MSPGAQFGDEEEEEDEAGPMEGVTEALPDAGGQLPLSACLQMGPCHICCLGLYVVSTNALFPDGSLSHMMLWTVFCQHKLTLLGCTMYRLSQCSQHLLLHLLQLNCCCIQAVTCVT